MKATQVVILHPEELVGRKMMAAVASGVIEEASPHSSKHDLVGSNNQTSAGGIYRKRF
jgi:hypothetical protein